MARYHHHRHSVWRENLESIATAIVLALVIRHFCFEAFQIPTGSMAPTLKGIHRTMVCPNCTRRFASDISKSYPVLCQNCRYHFDAEEVAASPCRDFPSWILGEIPRSLNGILRTLNPQLQRHSGGGGGNRILVNKFIFDYQRPQRWDVVVFKFPQVLASCRDPWCTQRLARMPRRTTPSVCPMCGGKLDTQRSSASVLPLDTVHCLNPECGWHENTRPRNGRCPTCHGRLKVDQKKNYIKRLIGLPGETVRIRHGDIYIDGAIARKGRKAQSAMWRFVHDSSLPSKFPNRSYEEFWTHDGGRLAREGKGFVLSPEDKNSPTWAEFRAPITDFVPYSGYSGGDLPVGDMRASIELQLPPVSSTLFLRIIEDDASSPAGDTGGQEPSRDLHEVQLVTRTDSSGRPDRWLRLHFGDRQVGRDVKLAEAPSLALDFWNSDDAVAVAVDGRIVLENRFDRGPDEVPADSLGARFLVGAQGSSLSVRRLRLWRDTYYRHNEPQASHGIASAEIAISKHGYFMMGDNSRNSSDSRMWGEAPIDFAIGKAFVIWYPFDDIREVR